MKRKIRLSENKLRRMVKEAVYSILKENEEGNYIQDGIEADWQEARQKMSDGEMVEYIKDFLRNNAEDVFMALLDQLQDDDFISNDRWEEDYPFD